MRFLILLLLPLFSMAQTTITFAPTSDLSFTGTWTGTASSRYTVVNDYPDASSNFLLNGTTAGNGYFLCSTPTVPAGATNISVSVEYYDRKTASQGAAWGAMLRVGTTAYLAATHNPAQTTTQRTDTWANNPATSTAWTSTTANSITGFGLTSTDASPTLEVYSIRLSITYTLVTTRIIRINTTR